jgi:hypothetical protein
MSDYKYASIVPLIGGETIAMEHVFNKKPEYIVSYEPFGNNDSHIVEHYQGKVPYHVLDASGNNPNFGSVDVVNTVCPCAGREMPEVGAAQRDTQFMVVLNEGTPSRYKLLKEWVLDEVEDCEIYGKWEHEDTEKDPRFKGSMPLEDLQEKLKGVRSTFIIPIKKGWVTSKYIEMIHAGVIPFFHPTYDEQDNLGVPKWLRPKNAAELKAAVAALENDKIYITAITELQDLFCRKEYYDGSKLNANVMEQLIDGYEPPCLDDYKNKRSRNSTLLTSFKDVCDDERYYMGPTGATNWRTASRNGASNRKAT